MRHDVLGVLEDIRGAAQYIADDTAGMTFAEFERDRRTRQVVERNFEIMGEAVNRLRRHAPHTVKHISSYVTIVDFRNALILGYDAIDYHRVWRVIQESLPILQTEVEQLLREMEENS